MEDLSARDLPGSLEAYLETLRARHCSPSTQRNARHILSCFFAHLEVSDLRAVREAHLVSFVRALKGRKTPRGTPVAQNTQINYLSMVRRFFAFLEERGVILLSPASELRLPRSLSLPRTVLNPRQAEALMNAPSAYSQLGKRDRAILELLYGTGIRRGECARLDVTDLDLKERVLLIRNGKGRKDRFVPLPGRAGVALEIYLREVRPEFLEHPEEKALFLCLSQRARGRRLTEGRIGKVTALYAQEAGLPHVYPHVLRHTCATHLLGGGASIRHVQQLLGHRQLRSTAIYTRVGVKDLAGVITRCHPRERKRRGKRK